MSNRESTSRTLMVALAVSLVSSVFVAGAAVSLKPVQVENRLLDKQRSILSIAGLGDAEMSSREVKDLFAGRIKARVSICRPANTPTPTMPSFSTRSRLRAIPSSPTPSTARKTSR